VKQNNLDQKRVKSKPHFTVKLPLKRRLRYLFETAIAFMLYGFFWLLPISWASNTGGAILRFIGPKLGASRKALTNIQNAFPEKPADEHQKILIGMWDNLGRVVAEYPHLHHIWKNVEFVGREHMEAVRDDGLPGFLFGGHLANWEVQAIAAKNINLDVGLVYRKPNNPWVDSLLKHCRNSGGSFHMTKSHQGARQIMSTLKAGGHIGMLVDQKLNEGIAIPFFGRDAMTAPAIAQLALKFKCPITPARVERVKGAKFRVTIYPPVEICPTGDKKEDVKRVMTDINKTLEGWIRERPEQWLWLHRRWPKETK